MENLTKLTKCARNSFAIVDLLAYHIFENIFGYFSFISMHITHVIHQQSTNDSLSILFMPYRNCSNSIGSVIEKISQNMNPLLSWNEPEMVRWHFFHKWHSESLKTPAKMMESHAKLISKVFSHFEFVNVMWHHAE